MNKGNILKFIKRSFVVLLCAVLLFVCVIFSSSYKVKAVVPAVAAGAALIVSALSAYMAASGVHVASNSNSNAADVVSMWEDICAGYEADGKTLESWYGEAGNAVNILIGKENAQKFAIASTTVCSWFDGLRDWILQKYGIDSSSPVTITGSQYFIDSNGKKIPYISNSSSSISASQFRDCDSIFPINNNTPVNTMYGFKISTYQYHFMVTSNNPTYQSSYGRMGFNVHNYSAGTTKSVYSTYFWGNNGSAKLLFVYTGSVLYAYIYSLLSNNSVYAGTQLFSLNVTNLATSSISVTGALSDGYQDLQDALNDAKTDAGVNGKIGIDIGDWDYAGVNTKEGVAEAYLDRIAATGTAEGTLTGGYTDEKEAEEETDAEFVPSGAWYEKNLIVVDGLEDFFPFCIPFDLIDLIDKFNVEPEAPVIHWNMSFANLYDDQELVLDFSPWETAALIFRICCLIGFAIFLILKTRDMIRG